MSSTLAKFFRWSNSKLIVADNILVSKLLKFVFFLSLQVYHRSKPSRGSASTQEVIRNFDTDISMCIDRSRSMGSALYWTGFHEFREFLFLHRYLRPDMVFVDVGANLGEYTLFAAKRLVRGKVLSFEPLPSMRRALEQNIALNGYENIRVYPFGLSSARGTMVIHEFEDVHEGLATFYPGDRVGGRTVSASLEKLDDVILAGAFERVDFVKIDIEGGELNALRGTMQVIDRFRPAFMVEMNALTYQAAGYTVGDVVDFFTKVNYRPYGIQKQGRLGVMTHIPEFANIIFMPQ